jgi:hypothetical protein
MVDDHGVPRVGPRRAPRPLGCAHSWSLTVVVHFFATLQALGGVAVTQRWRKDRKEVLLVGRVQVFLEVVRPLHLMTRGPKEARLPTWPVGPRRLSHSASSFRTSRCEIPAPPERAWFKLPRFWVTVQTPSALLHGRLPMRGV